MNFLLLFLFFIVSDGFFLHHPYSHRIHLDVKRKETDREIDLSLYQKEEDIYVPKTVNQQKYVDFMENRNISVLLGVGPAGSGKTLFACNSAVKELKAGLVDRIIITRPIFSVDEELGFLPGSLESKMNPWTRPVFDVLSDFYSVSQINSMVNNGIIEISPLAFMRGRTFKRSFIIADEMQNSSPKQMKMLLTRLGDDSRMVITGDLKQSDRSDDNGLYDFMHRLRRYNQHIDSLQKTSESNDSLVQNVTEVNIDSGCNHSTIQYVEFTNEDIQRSSVVANVLQIYDVDFLKKSEQKPAILRNFPSEKNRDDNNDAAMIPKTHYFPIGF
jgi:phosphate starvation-inducible protein PhoH and related proteins